MPDVKPKRCAICYTAVGNTVGDALEHCLEEHPRSDKLVDVLNDVWVIVECGDCGQEFYSPVSYGGSGRIGADSHCPECDQTGIRRVLAQTLTPREVLEREAYPFDDDSRDLQKKTNE